MKTKYIAFLCAAAAAVSVALPPKSYAQQDPETAARQARIDADEARSKIRELEQDRANAESVQDETSVELGARGEQIAQAQQDLADAEQREKDALSAER